MAINLHQLKIFHTVARSSSFSRAAAEMLISQPSVSIQVGELERQFGTDLFQQVGKSMRLTEAGRVLDDYAVRILALIDETRVAMDELKGLRRGRLLLGATPTPGTYLLPALLGRFKEHYPSCLWWHPGTDSSRFPLCGWPIWPVNHSSCGSAVPGTAKPWTRPCTAPAYTSRRPSSWKVRRW